jgi:hypothetical protein
VDLARPRAHEEHVPAELVHVPLLRAILVLVPGGGEGGDGTEVVEDPEFLVAISIRGLRGEGRRGVSGGGKGCI